MKKAVVTGASGFVGSALCKELCRQGIKVIAVVRNSNGAVKNVGGFQNITVINSDLSQFKDLPGLVEDRDIDVLFHLAWEGSSGEKRGDAEAQVNNIRYTCDTVRACSEMGIKRFVFASSIMEYELEAVMQKNGAPGINTLYSSGKLAANYMARAIAGDEGVSYVRALISNIYGPGEMSPRLVNASLRKLLAGECCAFSSGEQMYDFIYIDDAVRAMVAIGDKGKENKTYYIGSMEPRKLKEFLVEMKDMVDPVAEIGLGELPFDGVSLSYNEFDIGAVKEDTGFIPQVSFKEGISRTVRWIKSSGIF